MSTPPLPNPAVPPAPKKKGPLFWILIGVGTLVLLGCLAIGGVMFVGMKVMDRAGISVSDFKSNPAQAAARLMVATNPDLEVVDNNDDGQSITVRQKSSGEILTMRLNPDTKQIEFHDQSGKTLTINGANGRLEVRGDDGTVASIGADTGADFPSWIPSYPGTSPKSTLAATTTEGNSTTFTFTTGDKPNEIFDFYEQKFKDGGFTVEMRAVTADGGMMAVQDGDQRHQALVTLGAQGEVMIQATEKK